MADTEILNVLLKLENPQVFDRIEKLKSEQFQIKFSGSLDKGIKDILALQDKKISITADVQGAINSLKGIETSLKSLQNLKEIKLNLTGSALTDLDKIQKKMLELQAISLAPQLTQLGKVQNNNPKTLQGGANSINQAEGLKSIQDEFGRALNTLRARSVNPNRQLSNETVQKLVAESTATYNPGQAQSPRLVTYGEQVQLTAKQSAARRQEAELQKQERIAQAQADFKRSIELANAQTREEAIAKYRMATRGVPEGPFSPINGKELQQKRQQEIAAQALAGRTASKKELGGLLTELGLGAISGGGGGLLRLGGSLLGGLAGAAVPGGAILGSQIGGALGEGASKSLEAVAGALEDVTKAGIEFQKTIVALTGVFQANTDVVGADGKALSVADQVKFNSQQAKEIQKSARSALLPLGIGGEAEATLVQGLVSGFSQRGIILDAEQTKTVSSRIGAAIVALAPQILQNPNQERKDVEDIAANSPNAKRTTLGVALKSIAPDLFRPLATGDEIVKATARLEQFVQAIKNSDQATVQLLRVSGALDKLRTTAGDSFLQGLQPGLKSLADALDGDGLANGLEILGTTLGGALTAGIKIATPLLDNFSKSIGELAEILKKVFPGLAKVLEDPALAGAKSTAKAERQIFGDFTKLGQDTPLEDFDKVVKAEPNERLANIKRLQEKVSSFQDSSLIEKFIPALVEQEVTARKEALNRRLSTIETGTFPGRRLAALETTNSAQQDISSLQKGLQVAQFSYNQAKASGNIDEQSRQSAIINDFNQKIAEAGKAISLASKEFQNVALDERKAIQTVRNASEGLANAEKDQTLRLKDLTRSLQEATDAVTTFASKAEAAFASKEEQGLQAAKELRDAGGPDLLGDLDNRIKDAKLRSASAKFNEFSAEVGLGITAPEAESGLKLSRLGTPFSNSIDNQGAKLNDSVEAIGNELDRLPRVLRDLKEAFDDLIARTKQLFNSNNIPTNQPDIPGLKYPDGTSGGSSSGGVLSPASGGATGGGDLSRGQRPNRLAGKRSLRGGASGGDFDSDSKPGSSDYAENLKRIRGSGRRPDGSSRDDLPDPLDFLPDLRDQMNSTGLPNAPYSLGGLSGGVSNDTLGLSGGISKGDGGSLLETQKFSAAQDYGNISNIDKLMDITDPSNLTIQDFGRIQKSLGGPYNPSDEDGGDPNNEKFSEARKYIKDLLMFNSRRLPANLFERFDRMDELKRNPQAFSVDDTERYLQTRDPKQRIEARFANQSRGANGFFNFDGGISPFLLPDKREDGYDVTGRPPKPGDSDYLFQGLQDNPESTKEYYDTHYYGEVPPEKEFSYINPNPDAEFEFKQMMNPLFDNRELLQKSVLPVHDNPINFSDSLIARPSVPSRAYNPILREGLNEGLGNKADAKTNAVLEDVVGGFLDADVDGLKKKNRAPASGLKNGLFSGGLFGDQEGVKSGAGTDLTKFADTIVGAINATSDKITDQITKALGSAL